MSMLGGILTDTCYYNQRQNDTRDSYGKYQFTKSDEKPCMFYQQEGRVIHSPEVMDVKISGIFLLTEEIQPYDQIIYDGYIYDIISGGLIIRKSPYTNQVYHYKAYVQKRREYSEDKVTINSRVSE